MGLILKIETIWERAGSGSEKGRVKNLEPKLTVGR